MQYLLDTCVYLWAITNNRDKLSKKVLGVLLDNDNEIFVSIISQFETTIKHSKHQIENLSRPVIEYYKQQMRNERDAKKTEKKNKLATIAVKKSNDEMSRKRQASYNNGEVLFSNEYLKKEELYKLFKQIPRDEIADAHDEAKSLFSDGLSAEQVISSLKNTFKQNK